MDYKEKLKLAKEALDSGSYDKDTIEYIFPELKESEDDKKQEDSDFIDIPFGAFDSELYHQEIYIPDGFEATIKGNRVILKRKESEDERIRKELCKAIWTYVPTEEGQEYIAWLKKQGEQKPFGYENANIQQKDFTPKDYHDIDPHFFKTVD